MYRLRPVGIFRNKGTISLIGLRGILRRRLVLGQVRDKSFRMQADHLDISSDRGKTADTSRAIDARLSHVLGTSILTYSVPTRSGSQVQVAVHRAGKKQGSWKTLDENPQLRGAGMVVPEYRHEGQYVLYSGDGKLRVAFSRDLERWVDGGVELLSPREGHFDEHGLKLIGVEHLDQGLLVLYESRYQSKGGWATSAGAALFASDNPTHLLWRSDAPLWEDRSPAGDEKTLLGALIHDGIIRLYFTSRLVALGSVRIPAPFLRRTKHTKQTKLHRAPQNPVLSPTGRKWESEAVFNPGVFYDRGRVHLLYRAMGPEGISRIGYASSPDGIHFDERLEYPVYEPSFGFGAPSTDNKQGKKGYDPNLNTSGGGWAGCEDPRAVVIDGKAYMSFVAFDGWNYIRQAMTSISLEDLHQKEWKWKQPVLISKPGETHKNWVIFPEKIRGKYAVLHGLSPKLHIDYIDSLDELDGEKFIKSMPSHGGAGYHDGARQEHWDNRVRGAGSPPLKTPLGWLLLYHATDKRDPGKYKLGAMLLDLDDPTKVLYRSNAPVLEPQEWYENDGKPGVVYTCGAVIVGEHLVVYYGGGDKHIAVARANVRTFLEGLMKDEALSLEPVAIVS